MAAAITSGLATVYTATHAPWELLRQICERTFGLPATPIPLDKSDTFAVGVIGLQLLTGRLPQLRWTGQVDTGFALNSGALYAGHVRPHPAPP